MVEEKFLINGVKLLENAFFKQTIELFIFTYVSPQNCLQGSYHHSPGRGKTLIPNGSRFSKFIYPLAEREGREYCEG